MWPVWTSTGANLIGSPKCFFRKSLICINIRLSPKWKKLLSLLDPYFLTSFTTVAPRQPGLSTVPICCWLPPCRFPTELHSEIWNQRHLDVVCAPLHQEEPHPDPPGHWGAGGCEKGKTGSREPFFALAYEFTTSIQLLWHIPTNSKCKLWIVRLNSLTLKFFLESTNILVFEGKIVILFLTPGLMTQFKQPNPGLSAKF